MTTLLTGSGGFLGSRLAVSLLHSGVVDLRLLFRQAPPQGMLERLRKEYPAAQITPVIGNLLTKGFTQQALQGVTSVVHAAAGMKGAVADMFLNTVVASRNLMDGVVAAGVRRVTLISSFAVYKTIGLGSGATLDDATPLESSGLEKGPYAYCKVRQEQLCRQYAADHRFELILLRPGVIYGPGGGAMSPRVGLSAMGRFWSLGGGSLLPLTYVDNCADAISVAAMSAPAGAAYSVVDDDLPTCSAYLKMYRREVERLKVMRVPYPLFLMGASMMQRYNRKSDGQLPAIFTPYTVRSMYRPLRYSNAPLKEIGWRPAVATAEGLARTFSFLKEQRA